jgi:hypothetical protein
MRTEQQSPRFKRRLPCNLAFQGRRDSGIVLNLSEGGLYVQTNLGARRGSIVDVAVQSPSGSQSIALQARVVWKRVKNSHVLGLDRSGLGLEIREPIHEYADLIQDIGGTGERGADACERSGTSPTRESATPSSEQHEVVESLALPPTPAYRVRLKLEGSPRTRTLRIHASSTAEALSQVASESGPGWEVIEIDEP